MSSLSDLPIELVQDHLVPFLSPQSLLALGATNHLFQSICYDETLWKLKCKSDFNFSGSATARTRGWRVIYKGLSNPKVFVWGSAGNGRLGIPLPERTSGIPYPKQITFPKNSAIVDLVSGGWSYNALDSWGQMYVWGTLNGEGGALRSDGFSISQKIAESPLKLKLPEPIVSLSCGRKHSSALDKKGQLWTFLSWGRPFRLVSPALNNSCDDSIPVQIECGWSYSTALTKSGTVFVWWPFEDEINRSYDITMEHMDRLSDKRARATEGVIPCETWDLHHNPRQLPPIPSLPMFKNQISTSERNEDVTKLVKIAAMDNILIGLTNKGHVLKFSELRSPTSLQAEGRWEYLPCFSEAEKIHDHPIFYKGGSNESSVGLVPPTDIKITHITAHFRHFYAYTNEDSSIVLGGTISTGEQDTPDIIPELQYKKVISISLGDYHSAALTADGRLFTWGGFQQGALGLGDPADLPVGAPGGYESQQELDSARNGRRRPVPRAVEKPAEVRFDHGSKKRRDKFCFAATAAGWHTGALVIDLDSDGEEEEEKEKDKAEPTSRMPGYLGPQAEAPISHFGPGQLPGIIPMLGRGHAPFRIGFAGRGHLGPRGRSGHNGESS